MASRKSLFYRQVIYYYSCPNPKCENFNRYFNPVPRYDFSKSHFGKDVIDRIAKELFIFKQNPEQIHLRLTVDYHLEIDLRTVQRMCRDILLVKSAQIDKNTKEIISRNKGIVLAADAQDPGKNFDAIWLFTDAVSGRLLKTVLTPTMTSGQLHNIIDGILIQYQTKLLGAVSDKQNNLERCFREYYPNIPHQFCTYHFINHLWSPLEILDNRIYSTLVDMITHLYMNTKSSDQLVYFEGLGDRAVTDVFKPINTDLYTMSKLKNIKFEQLHGLILYRAMKRYVGVLNQHLAGRLPTTRIEKILNRAVDTIQNTLHSIDSIFRESVYLFDMFRVIYGLIYAPTLYRMEKQQHLDFVFGDLWKTALSLNSSITLESLKNLKPNSQKSCSQILAEWVRLWNSYLPGLFSYYEFPKVIQTNEAQEQAFSEEKILLIRRMAKKEVGAMLAFQGEKYLRIVHCDSQELTHDIIKEYNENEVQLLLDAYHDQTTQVMAGWAYKDEEYHGIDDVLKLNKINRLKKDIIVT